MNKETSINQKNDSNQNKANLNINKNKLNNNSSDQNKNKNDINQKHKKNIKMSEGETKSYNPNMEDATQNNIKKQKFRIPINTAEDKHRQVEFIQLHEEDSEDPLDQFEDAMEEDDHIDTTKVTNQENCRTKTKFQRTLLPIRKTRPKSKLQPNGKPQVPSLSVYFYRQQNALEQISNYHQIPLCPHHHWA